MAVRSFTIDVEESVLTDLQQRLALARWPDEIEDSGWDYGTNLAYLQQLVDYWRTDFDWRAQEQLLNSFPQFIAEVDGQEIHFIHVKGKGPNPLPLLLSHGWPGSFFEMYKVIGPLTDPGYYGADPLEAFDVVVPSLPGYGFSGRPRTPGMNVPRIAELFKRLMTEELGYDRFGAQGGDWGSGITLRLGQEYPDHLIGVHVNMVPLNLEPTEGEPSEEEQYWREQLRRFQSEGAGYSHIQGTRPQTLAYALNESPVGLAAWIIDKFRAWSDCHNELEQVFTRDELLTNIMIYWVTQTIGSSMRLYYETTHSNLAPYKVDVPTGVALFPREISTPPQELAGRQYNIQRWTTMSAGGHFAALEQPTALVHEIRAFFKHLRP
ncbi:epoxide hydrolase family protein [Dictyobacter kobayashii]|uniref:Multidrug MFS transporter n=1 Tax=Dictyobacter kobayashii TaxID=2014872 RepID=A0A402AYL8_9CHLR|nr:epoxide hydrolase family protein [Dictyobacter kobayashii]GCE24167.1 multidrug MFS transporter [Dictyobacter kobayashii]